MATLRPCLQAACFAITLGASLPCPAPPPPQGVEINQAAGQSDPAAAAPINFTVVFYNSLVTPFTGAMVDLSGSSTPGTLVATVTGGPATFNVAVTGMTGAGVVSATIPAGVATDLFGELNPASISADNTVGYVGTTQNSFTGASATGTGNITATFTPAGSCSYTSTQLLGAPPGTPPVPPVSAPNQLFPHGLFDFTVGGCNPGATLTFTITYPALLPAGTRYWKYGPTAPNPTPHWYVLPATIAGTTATFSITDGGLGDDDLTANGTIVDQGGPAVGGPAVPTPALDHWTLGLLGLLMVLSGAFLARRRPGR